MHELSCGEVWGGIRNHEEDVQSTGLVASLFSASCDGGKGGDVYYLSLCESGQLTRFAIADVAGHGQVVSDISQRVYDSLEARMNAPEGDAVLHDVNELACAKGIKAMTTALVAGYFAPESRLLFVSAGHPPLLVWRRQEDTWTAENPPSDDADRPANLPLGVLHDVIYIQTAEDIHQGDRLFMYTDGLTEARNAEREELGAQTMLEILNGLGDAPLPHIKSSVLARLREHTGGALDHDDVTFLLVEIT